MLVVLWDSVRLWPLLEMVRVLAWALACVAARIALRLALLPLRYTRALACYAGVPDALAPSAETLALALVCVPLALLAWRRSVSRVSW